MKLKVEYSFRNYRYDHYEYNGSKRIEVDIKEADIPVSIRKVFTGSGDKEDVKTEEVLTLVRRLAEISPWRDFGYFVNESPDNVFIKHKKNLIAIGRRFNGCYLEIVAV